MGNKSKEFFIYKETSGLLTEINPNIFVAMSFVPMYLYDKVKDSLIKVIEYSAYEKQKERVAELEDLLLDIEPSVLPENHRLRRQKLLKGVYKK